MKNMLYSTSLDQIFEVIRISKTHYSSGSSITDATQIAINNVSKQYKVTYQTIVDGCRRRLGLNNIADFRRLLIEYFNGDPKNLISVLKDHTYPKFYNKIYDYFGECINNDEEMKMSHHNTSLTEQTTELFSFRLDTETSKKLKMIVGYEGVSTPEWISNTIKKKVTEDLRNLLDHLVKE